MSRRRPGRDINRLREEIDQRVVIGRTIDLHNKIAPRGRRRGHARQRRVARRRLKCGPRARGLGPIRRHDQSEIDVAQTQAELIGCATIQPCKQLHTNGTDRQQVRIDTRAISQRHRSKRRGKSEVAAGVCEVAHRDIAAKRCTADIEVVAVVVLAQKVVDGGGLRDD